MNSGWFWSAQILNDMKLGDTITIGNRTVTKVSQKNGKEVWSIGGWICRSEKSVLSWISWDEKQQARHGKK